jgi:hypothetical protein
MPRHSYLIVGLAKTGTTIIATTLRNTLRINDFCIEPQEIASVAKFDNCDRLVIKIIFDHWRLQSEALRTFAGKAIANKALTAIILVRDPRDEAISRLHYFAFDYFSGRPTTEEERDEWVDVFRRKEAEPDRIGLTDMQRHLMDRFGRGFLPDKEIYNSYSRFIDDMLTLDASACHLLRYEDFIGDNVQNPSLDSILSGPREIRVAELEQVRRTGSSGEWNSYLTDEDLKFINGTCEAFLRKFGYPLQRQSARGRPSPATGSQYVQKLIDEARRRFHKRLERTGNPSHQ